MPSPAIAVAPAPATKPPPPPQSIKKMIALFDYNATENSPNANPDEELSFHAGDIIYVYGNVHDDGFYYGQLENESKGLVPSNFLKEVATMNTDEHPHHHHHHHSQQENDSLMHAESKVRNTRTSVGAVTELVIDRSLLSLCFSLETCVPAVKVLLLSLVKSNVDLSLPLLEFSASVIQCHRAIDGTRI